MMMMTMSYHLQLLLALAFLTLFALFTLLALLLFLGRILATLGPLPRQLLLQSLLPRGLLGQNLSKNIISTIIIINHHITLSHGRAAVGHVRSRQDGEWARFDAARHDP